MRQLVQVVFALALVVATGAAHASNDTLVWDIAAGPQYVDPGMGTSAQANVMVLQNVYERLVWYDGPGTQPIPWLATGWEAKDGGRRWVFKLRKGIKFHDGTELDANAVKFSLDRSVLLDDPTGIGSFFPTGTAAPGILKGAWEFSKSFGAGKVVLRANPNYWGGPKGDIKPKLKTVVVRATLDQATRLLNLKAGTVDVADITTAAIFDVIDKKKWLDDKKIEPVIPGVAVPG